MHPEINNDDKQDSKSNVNIYVRNEQINEQMLKNA
jgi:hypothetical protein